MKTKSPSSPSVIKEIYSHGLCKYLLVVRPSPDVYEKIMAEKQLFYDGHKGRLPIQPNPQIVIGVFFAKEAMEDTLARWIQRICQQQHSFTVTLNNYSGFPAHTIYLRVQTEKPFQELADRLSVLNTYFNSCACPPMQFTPKPYISIAGNLPENIYSNALIKYALQSFHESFVVNEFQMLKRKHEYDTAKPINIFGLAPAKNSGVIDY